MSSTSANGGAAGRGGSAAEPQCKAEVVLGIDGAVHIVGVPKTSFTIDAAQSSLVRQGLTYTLTLKGQCTNIAYGTVCDVLIAVGYDEDGNPYKLKNHDLESITGELVAPSSGGGGAAAPARGGGAVPFEVKLHLADGSTAPVTLDVARQGLLGTGTLTCRLHVPIPHCNLGRESTSFKARFDNNLVLSVESDDNTILMGTRVVFRPQEATGAFQDTSGLRLLIEERNTAESGEEGRAPSPEDEEARGALYALDWTLKELTDRVVKTWRVGCHLLHEGPPDKVSLIYPNEHETGPYNLLWRACARVEKADGEVDAIETPAWRPFAEKVPRPTLKAFSLTISRPSAGSAGTKGGAGATPEGGAKVLARIELAGFASGVSLPISVALWQVQGSGALEQVSDAIEADFETGRVLELPIPAAELTVTKNLFAVLELRDVGGAPRAAGDAAPGLPMSSIIDYGRLRLFRGDFFSSDAIATGICSKEADGIKTKPLLDYERVEGVLWKSGGKSLKAELQTILDGKLIPGAGKPPSCPPRVAASLRSGLVALGFDAQGTAAAPAVPWEDYAWTNKAFGRFLRHHDGGSVRHLLLDRDRQPVGSAELVALFEREDLDAMTKADLDRLPIVPVTSSGFEVLLHAILDSTP